MTKPAFDVLVTGAEERQGLAVIRALGASGLRVFAMGLKSDSIGFHSRYAAGTAVYPSPFADKRAMADAVLEPAARHAVPVLLPVTESTVIAIDEHRELFAGVSRVALPPSESLRAALDKRRTMQIATDLGVPIPRSIHPRSVDDAMAFAHDVGLPLIVKPPSQSIMTGAAGKFDFKVEYISSIDDFARRMEAFATHGAFPLVQEFCAGVKVNQGVLIAGGEVAGLYQYRGSREYPLTGGVTSLHETMAVDATIAAWTTSLLRAMNWDGIAMVEYKVNEATGRKVLLEVNGRVWAPISGAIGAGLNFPAAAIEYVRTGRVARLPDQYPVGVQQRYMRGDLEGLMHRITNPPSPVHDTPGVGLAFLNVARAFAPSVQSESVRMSDPLPGLVELKRVAMEFPRRIAGVMLRRLKGGRRA